MSQNNNKFDFFITGGGVVGLCIAYQLIKRNISNKILIFDKEQNLGMHTSGRNSGVLHAGLYYEPNTIKANVCVSGAKRLKKWIKERNLPINECGKLILPTSLDLDSQLDLLAERGIANGAKVEFWNEKKIKELVPSARCVSGRGLWSPNTCVVKPITVIKELQSELLISGVQFLNSSMEWDVYAKENKIVFSNGDFYYFDKFINTAGLQADKVAHKFGIAKEYTLIPFKGVYYQIKDESNLKIKTNLYPVPDLNLPFLGVHFTPSADKDPYITIGPTASLAFGRENYRGLEEVNPIMTLQNLSILASQYLNDRGGFRKYAKEQAFLSMPNPFLKAAKELLPELVKEDIRLSEKVGIRAQLFNKKTLNLENDFICLKGENSLHILNSISPAFTASFSLADFIIDNNISNFS